MIADSHTWHRFRLQLIQGVYAPAQSSRISICLHNHTTASLWFLIDAVSEFVPVCVCACVCVNGWEAKLCGKTNGFMLSSDYLYLRLHLSLTPHKYFISPTSLQETWRRCWGRKSTTQPLRFIVFFLSHLAHHNSSWGITYTRWSSEYLTISPRFDSHQGHNQAIPDFYQWQIQSSCQDTINHFWDHLICCHFKFNI